MTNEHTFQKICMLHPLGRLVLTHGGWLIEDFGMKLQYNTLYVAYIHIQSLRTIEFLNTSLLMYSKQLKAQFLVSMQQLKSLPQLICYCDI